MLACPSCRALVHRDELTRLGSAANDATARGDAVAAMSAWRAALELLPPTSVQAAKVVEKIRSLRNDDGQSSLVLQGAAPRPDERPAGAESKTSGNTGERPKRTWVALASSGVALILFKLKWLWALSKPLLLGFTKLGTLVTMLAALGAYWAAFGWKFALGLVLTTYVHEIGHVVALQRLGIAGTAPMFVPGLGAFVRFKQYPIDALEDARIGLAGPIWGLGATAAAIALGKVGGWPALLATGKVSGWINLFNLIPVPPLDGGRGFRAIEPAERMVIAVTLGAAYFLVREPLMLLLAGLALLRAFEPRPENRVRSRAFAEYIVVALFLSLAASLPIEPK